MIGNTMEELSQLTKLIEIDHLILKNEQSLKQFKSLKKIKKLVLIECINEDEFFEIAKKIEIKDASIANTVYYDDGSDILDVKTKLIDSSIKKLGEVHVESGNIAVSDSLNFLNLLN